MARLMKKLAPAKQSLPEPSAAPAFTPATEDTIACAPCTGTGLVRHGRSSTRVPCATCKGSGRQPDPAVAAAEAAGFILCEDNLHHHALVVARGPRTVKFITLTPTEGLYVQAQRDLSFDLAYRPAHYPVLRACRKFLQWAQSYGATDDVLEALGRVITISPVEKEAAMAVKTEKKEKKKMTPEVAAKLKAGRKPKEPKEKRASASALFKDLIMAGNFSDDVIFKKVQEKFGLPDNKRSYVGWYRNHLKKAGQYPPDAKCGAAKKVAPAEGGRKKAAKGEKKVKKVEAPEAGAPAAEGSAAE